MLLAVTTHIRVSGSVQTWTPTSLLGIVALATDQGSDILDTTVMIANPVAIVQCGRCHLRPGPARSEDEARVVSHRIVRDMMRPSMLIEGTPRD